MKWRHLLLLTALWSLSSAESGKAFSSDVKIFRHELVIGRLGKSKFTAQLSLDFNIKKKSVGKETFAFTLLSSNVITPKSCYIEDYECTAAQEGSLDNLKVEIYGKLKEDEQYVLTIYYEGAYDKKGLFKYDDLYNAASYERDMEYIFPYDDQININLTIGLNPNGENILITNLGSFPAGRVRPSDVAFLIGKFKVICNKFGVVTYGLKVENDAESACNLTSAALVKLMGYIGHGRKLIQLVDVPNIGAGGFVLQRNFFEDPKQLHANEIPIWKSSLVAPIAVQYLRLDFNDRHWFPNSLPLFLSDLILDEINEEASLNESLQHQFIINQLQPLTLQYDAFGLETALNSLEFEILGRKYVKGYFILRFIHSVWGKKNFFLALRQLCESDDRVFEFNDFIAKLNEIQNMPQDFIKNWVEKPGYPVVHVKRDKTEYNIVQDRFTWKDEASDTVWTFPMDYETSNATGREWIIKKKTKTNAPLKIVNYLYTGLYRVNYDGEMWDSIVNQLEKNNSQINEINRAQIINDAFSLAKSTAKFSEAVPDYNTALKLFSYIKREKDFAPLGAAANSFSELYWKLYGEPSFEDLTKLFRESLSEIWKREKINFTEIAYEDQNKRLAQGLVKKWACKLGLSECTKPAVEQFERHVKNSVKLHPDIQDIVICTAAQESSENAKTIQKIYEESNKINFFYVVGLTCAKDENIIQWLLSESLTNHFTILNWLLYNNPENANVTAQFIMDRKDDLIKKNSYNIYTSLLHFISTTANAELSERVKKFAEKMEAKNEYLEYAISTTELTIQWRKTRFNSIPQYFRSSSVDARPTVSVLLISAAIPAARRLFFS